MPTVTVNGTFPWMVTTGGTTTVTTGFNFPWVTGATNSTYGAFPWMTTTANTTATYADLIWTGWNDDPANGYARGGVLPSRPWVDTRTPEEIQATADAAQAIREAESRRRLAAQTQLAHAQDRALELLEMILTPEEKVHRANTSEITVRGSDGGLFVIEEGRGVHGNIRETDEHGCTLGRACVAPRMFDDVARAALPLADGIVGQYLAIKHDEATLRRVANWSLQRPCAHPGVPILQAA